MGKPAATGKKVACHGRDVEVSELARLAEIGGDWLWETDSRHKISFLSDGFAAVTGIAASKIVGRSRLDYVGRPGDEAVAAHLAVLERREPFHGFTHQIRDGSGRCRPVSISGHPRFSKTGAFIGYRGIGRRIDADPVSPGGGEAAPPAGDPDRGSSGAGQAERLLAAFDAMSDAYCYFDADDRLERCNIAMTLLHPGLDDVLVPGTSFETLLDTALDRKLWLTDGRARDEWRQAVLQARREGVRTDRVIALSNGRWVMQRDLRTAEGGKLCFCTDVSAIKRHEADAEAARHEADATLSDMKRTLETMRMGVVILDRNLDTLVINKAFYDYCGASPGDMPVGCSFRRILEVNRNNGNYAVTDREWECYVATRIDEIRSGKIDPREMRRADGSTAIFQVRSLSDGRRLLTYFDVTDIKEREHELSEALEKSKLAESVVDTVPGPIFVKNERLEFVLVNKAFADIFGWAPADMIGRKAAEFVSAEEAADFEQSERAVLDTGEEYKIEEDHELDGKSGTRIVHKHKVRTGSGTGYVACTIFDVTEMKQREREADEARRQLASVLDSLPAGVVIYDRDDRFVMANRHIHQKLPFMVPAMEPGMPLRAAIEAAHTAGYFRESGDPGLDRLYDTDREAWIEGYLKRYHVPRAVDERHNPDGSWFQVYDMRTEDGTYIGVRVDISELKQREAELRESMRDNEIFRSLIDNVPVSIYAKHPDLRLMYVNKGWCDLTGFAADFAVGRTDAEVFGKDGEAFMEADREVLRIGRHGRAGGDRQRCRRHGALPGRPQGQDDGQRRQRLPDRLDQRHHRAQAPRGRTHRSAAEGGTGRSRQIGIPGQYEPRDPHPDERRAGHGRTAGQDRSRRQAEDLHRHHREVGQRVADHHQRHPRLLQDRRRPARARPGSVQPGRGDRGRRHADVDARQGEGPRAAGSGRARPAALFRRRCRARAPDHHQPARQCHQVHRSRPRGRERVRRPERGRNEAAHDRRGHRHRHSARKAVGDLREVQPGRFVLDPAARGHRAGPRHHLAPGRDDGRRRSASKAPRARARSFHFSLMLPVAERAEAERPTPVDVTGARILIVDDNPVNRSILSEQMASWGFDSCAAENGPEGIQVLKAASTFGVDVDCVVLDYQMPGMNGAEVARLIRSMDGISNTPIVMLTSVDQSLANAQHRALAIDAQLLKPTRSSLLLETLVATIQRRRAEDMPFGEHLSEPAPDEAAAEAADDTADLEPSAQADPRGAGVDILVAEDNEVNQLVFTQILGETNRDFEIVSNGRLAVEAFKELRPGMILMDVSMPEMSGLEATQAIRALEAETGGHVPIIGVTAHALKGDRERCLEAGMDDYLSKPISPKALLQKVERWLARPRARLEQAG